MQPKLRRALLGAMCMVIGGTVGFCTASRPPHVAHDSRKREALPRAIAPALPGTTGSAPVALEREREVGIGTAGVTHRRNRDMLEQFAQEPRDAAFADRREAYLRRVYGGMLQRLAPGTSVTELECRTSVCVIEVTLPDDPWAHDVVGWLPWGDRRSTTDVVASDGRLTTEIVAEYAAETRGHDYFEQVADDTLHRIELGLVELHAQRLADAGVD